MTTETKHTPASRKLYYHKTLGGAEYLCDKKVAMVTGTQAEGDMSATAVRLDGQPELLGVYAAAPCLAEALRELCRAHGKNRHAGYIPAYNAARAALRKAGVK